MVRLCGLLFNPSSRHRPKERCCLSACLGVEERHILFPGLSLVPADGEWSEQEIQVQPGYQPAGWLQYVQVTSAGGEGFVSC